MAGGACVGEQSKYEGQRVFFSSRPRPGSIPRRPRRSAKKERGQSGFQASNSMASEFACLCLRSGQTARAARECVCVAWRRGRRRCVWRRATRLHPIPAFSLIASSLMSLTPSSPLLSLHPPHPCSPRDALPQGVRGREARGTQGIKKQTVIEKKQTVIERMDTPTPLQHQFTAAAPARAARRPSRGTKEGFSKKNWRCRASIPVPVAC